MTLPTNSLAAPRSPSFADQPTVQDPRPAATSAGPGGPVDVVHIGLGPIGREIVAFLAGRRQYRSVGAVDVDPELIGRPLSDVADLPRGCDPPIVGEISDLPSPLDGAVAIHCAGSSLERVAPTLRALLSAGYHVVSTCEELAQPWATAPDLAAELDRTAAERGAVLLGTGVNPGYAMDYLPVVLAGSQRSVRGVEVRRVQDAGQRRVPLQRKVGAGLTVTEFEDRVAQGTIRHVGLAESAWLLDRALGLGCTEVAETIDPIIAQEDVAFGGASIAAGHVLGIDQLVVGTADGVTRVRLHLTMAVGLDDPRDEVILDGEPGLSSVVRGLHGDVATAAVVVNSLGRLRVAAPGLRTVDEIPAAPLNL